jgi:hypothetical protein
VAAPGWAVSADLGGVVRLRRRVRAGEHHARLRQGAEHAARPIRHASVFRPPRAPCYLEVRGTVVELTEEVAAEHNDALASKYAGRPIRFFGDAVPARFAETEVPVLAGCGRPTSWRSTRDRRREGHEHRRRAPDPSDPCVAPRSPGETHPRGAHHDGRSAGSGPSGRRRAGPAGSPTSSATLVSRRAPSISISGARKRSSSNCSTGSSRRFWPRPSVPMIHSMPPRPRRSWPRCGPCGAP